METDETWKAQKERGLKPCNPVFVWVMTAVRKRERMIVLGFFLSTEMKTFLCAVKFVRRFPITIGL